jgi:hypothetical protein
MSGPPAPRTVTLASLRCAFLLGDLPLQRALVRDRSYP